MLNNNVIALRNNLDTNMQVLVSNFEYITEHINTTMPSLVYSFNSAFEVYAKLVSVDTKEEFFKHSYKFYMRATRIALIANRLRRESVYHHINTGTW